VKEIFYLEEHMRARKESQSLPKPSKKVLLRLGKKTVAQSQLVGS